jgi:hypothetical protein
MFNADDRTTGSDTRNTAIGYQALFGGAVPANNTGVSNTALGYLSLKSNTGVITIQPWGTERSPIIHKGNFNTAIGNVVYVGEHNGRILM